MPETHQPDEVALVLTTCPDGEGAESLALSLIEARLAACVNVLPAMTSHYWWEGRVERAVERQLVAKTTRGRVAALVAFLSEHHPYELPECVVLAADASGAYLDWVRRETGARGATR